MRYFILLLGLGLLTQCSSKKDVTVSLEEAPKFTQKLNSSTTERSEKVGVKDDTVKIQRTVYLEEDLTKMQREIEDLENRVYGQSKTYPGGLYLSLKTCRGKNADARLGGNGVPEPMEKWERVSEKDADYNYHVDKDNNVVGVQEEDLASRISNLRKLRRVLNDTFDSLQTKMDTCEQKHQSAMLQNGLNPEDSSAQGEWVEGPNGYRVWKMRRPATNDPEEMARRKSEREKIKVE